MHGGSAGLLLGRLERLAGARGGGGGCVVLVAVAVLGGAREPHGEDVAAAARDAADAVQVLGPGGEGDEAAGTGVHEAFRVVVDEGQRAAVEVGAARAEVEERRVVVGRDVGLVDVGVPVHVARVHIPLVRRRVGDEPREERAAEVAVRL